MNCPGCAYQSPYAAMRCPQCRQIFDSEAVETLGHLVYLRERLEGWRAAGVLDADDAAEALSLAEQWINQRRTEWQHRFDRLGAYLDTLKIEGGSNDEQGEHEGGDQA